MPDSLMECTESPIRMSMQNPALLGRDVRLKAPRGRFRSSTAHAKLRNHLMHGFSKLQVLGCTCPRPVGLQPLDDRIVGVKGAVSRSVRRVGPVCGSGLQGGCAPAGHAAGNVQRGTRVGTIRLDYKAIVGMGAHVSPCREAMTRQVTRHIRIRIVFHECSGLNTSKVLQLQLAISPQPLTRLRRFKNLYVAN